MVKEIWTLADQLGLSAFEYRIGYEIYDDHVPLWENAQIPAIDIIDFEKYDEIANKIKDSHHIDIQQNRIKIMDEESRALEVLSNLYA